MFILYLFLPQIDGFVFKQGHAKSVAGFCTFKRKNDEKGRAARKSLSSRSGKEKARTLVNENTWRPWPRASALEELFAETLQFVLKAKMLYSVTRSTKTMYWHYMTTTGSLIQLYHVEHAASFTPRNVIVFKILAKGAVSEGRACFRQPRTARRSIKFIPWDYRFISVTNGK